MSSANSFVKQFYGQEKPGIGERIAGSLPASKRELRKSVDELSVDTMENTLLIKGLYDQLGLEMPDLEHKAVELVGARKEKKILDKKVEEYEKREDAYLNGSILEKSRRFFGGTPQNPLKEKDAPVINIQLPEGLLGHAQAQPQAQVEDPRIQKMELEIQGLTKSMEALVTAIGEQFKSAQKEDVKEEAKA